MENGIYLEGLGGDISYAPISAKTGEGIPERVQARIFEPFFSTKPIHKGSGLGLIIAKEVVERSGGLIGFNGRPQGGTTFHIRVPVAPAEAGEHGP